MAHMDITGIVLAVIGILGAVAEALLIPWLKTKLDAARLEKAAKIAQALVRAAEAYFDGPGQGVEKLDWVKAQLAARGITFDEDVLRGLIETEVAALGRALVANVPSVTVGSAANAPAVTVSSADETRAAARG
jgi:type II secretory pathway pseudopilin PulG